MDTLASLLSPLTVDEFLDAYWGTRSVRVEGDETRFDDLFGWDSFNRILNANVDPHPSAIITNKHRRKDADSHEEIRRAVQNGDTLVIFDADKYDETLGEYLNRLTQDLAHNMRFNAYLSQPGREAYKCHYDSHDSFILQVKGTKRWKVYPETISSPLEGYNMGASTAPPEEDLYMDLVMKPGDVMYVPRGHWHSVVAEEEMSLHLTLSLAANTGLHVLGWLTEQLTRSVTFRESVPLIHPEDRSASAAETLQPYLDRLTERLLKEMRDPALADRFYDHLIASCKDRNVHGFPEIAEPPTDEQLRESELIRPVRLHRVVQDEDAVRVVGQGRKLTFSHNCFDLIDYVFANTRFTVADVRKATSLDEASILQVLHHLIQQGYLILDRSPQKAVSSFGDGAPKRDAVPATDGSALE